MRIRPVTSQGGADVAIGGGGKVHIVTSNLEDGWPAPPWDDASVYTSTRGRARAWGRDVLLGGIAPNVAASGRDVWITYMAYACGPGNYADPTGIAVTHSQDRGQTWSGPLCLTWARGLTGSMAAAGRVVYIVGSQQRRDVTVWVSRNGGATYTRTLLVRKPRSGCCGGVVQVAAAGKDAAIAWRSRGKVKVRISRDAGSTWSKTEVLPLADLDGAGGRGGRLAFWGGDPGNTTLAMWTPSGGWSSQLLPDIAWEGTDYDPDSYSGALLVGLGPRRELAILGSGAHCIYDYDYDVVTGASTWVRSLDNGRTWTEPVMVQGCRDQYDSRMVIGAGGRPYVVQEDVDWGYDLLIGPRRGPKA